LELIILPWNLPKLTKRGNFYKVGLMKVFSGSSNPRLARKVAKVAKIKFGKVELSRFANGEARVFVKDKVNNSTAVVLQSFSKPVDEHIIEFCLLCDALKRLGAKKIIAIVPWLGYSKQDKVFREGEPLSIKVIAKIIQTAPFDKLIVFDLHNQSIIGFFDKPVVQLSARSLFLEYFKRICRDRPCRSARTVPARFAGEYIVIAPDAGSIKNSTAFARKLNLPIAYIDKERDLISGKVKIHGISKEVKGKKAIIVDDMISTGSTLIETARFLKKKGVKKAYVAATHHLFVPGATQKLLKSPIDKLLISDTIMPKSLSKSKKLEVLSVAGIIKKELKNL